MSWFRRNAGPIALITLGTLLWTVFGIWAIQYGVIVP